MKIMNITKKQILILPVSCGIQYIINYFIITINLLINEINKWIISLQKIINPMSYSIVINLGNISSIFQKKILHLLFQNISFYLFKKSHFSLFFFLKKRYFRLFKKYKKWR